jgi:hypothetical protein
MALAEPGDIRVSGRITVQRTEAIPRIPCLERVNRF